jgi:hypothetical protein
MTAVAAAAVLVVSLLGGVGFEPLGSTSFLLDCVRSCYAHAPLGLVLAALLLLSCIASLLAGTAAFSLQSLACGAV